MTRHDPTPIDATWEDADPGQDASAYGQAGPLEGLLWLGAAACVGAGATLLALWLAGAL